MIKSDSEFLQYAMNHYDNPSLCFIEEFESDLKRFTYINNLINRYQEDKSDLKHRLIINHIIILENCFGTLTLLNMIDYKILKNNRKVVDTFLFYLKRIDTCKYELDFYLLDILNDE